MRTASHLESSAGRWCAADKEAALALVRCAMERANSSVVVHDSPPGRSRRHTRMRPFLSRSH